MTRMLANSTVPKRQYRGTALLLAALAVLFGWGCADDTTAPTAPVPAPVPTPEPEPEPPGVPTGLRVSANGEDFIEWRWNAVERADSYDVQFSANEAFTAEDEIIARTAQELSYRREGLAAGTSVYLRVRSAAGTREDRLESAWSAHVAGMTAAPEPTTPLNQRAVLIDFYNGTNGPTWINSTRWNTSAPLGEWHGVTTDSDGNVTSLSLFANGLTGTIPDSLGNLTSLEHLDLSHNGLTGTIPDSLGNLANLESLALFANQLTGTIPDSLGNLTHLQRMNLATNQLTGTIPDSLGNLTNLESLELFENQLTGTIPDSLGNLANLEYLALFANQLTGTIPDSLCKFEDTIAWQLDVYLPCEVTRSDDHGNTQDEATPIDVNSSTRGTLETLLDLDYFRLEMPFGGGLLDIETTGATDTVGILYGADSSLVLYSDDDSGSGLNFKILTGFLPEGAYFVEVSGFDAGDYALQVEFKEGAAGTGRIQPGYFSTLDDEGLAEILEIAALLREDVSGEHAEILRILQSWGLDLTVPAAIGCQSPEVLQEILAREESLIDPGDFGEVLSAYIDVLKDVEPSLRSRECGLFFEGTGIDWDGEERVLEAGGAVDDQPVILVWGTPEVGVPVRPAARSRWWVFRNDTTFREITSSPMGFALSRPLANVARVP